MGKKTLAPKKSRPPLPMDAASDAAAPAPRPSPLSAFDETADNFAAVSQSACTHRLRVIDTATHAVGAEFESKKKITCIAWGRLPLQDAQHKGPLKKKTRRLDGPAGALRPPGSTTAKVVALGLEDGSVALFSPAQGSVLKTLSGGHTQSITDVIFSGDGRRVYTAAEDSIIIEWNSADGSVLAKWPAGHDIRRLAFCHDESRLASAGHSIKIWNLESKSCVKKFAGHATLVSDLLFSEDDDLCITSADQDRFINLWSVAQETQGDAIALTVDTNVLSVAARSTVAGDFDLLCVTDEGVVKLWRNPTKSPVTKSKKKSSTRQPDASLVVYNAGEEATEDGVPAADIQQIFAATFVGDSQVMVARGSALKLVFERVNYISENGTLVPDIRLVRPPATNLLMDSGFAAASRFAATKRNYDETKTTILDSTDFGLPSAGINGTVEQTLEERLHDLAVAEDGAKPVCGASNGVVACEKVAPGGAPKASSLSTALVQALHSADHQLLELCLTHTNPEVIRSSVRRLPPQYVVPLLREIVARFQRRPNRAVQLLEWVRAPLLLHAGYLMTVPELVRELSGFYQAMDARLASFRRLMHLSGRLEMVNTQISARHARLEATDATPVGEEDERDVVYVEGEEDDDADSIDHVSGDDTLDLGDMMLDEDEAEYGTDDEEMESELSAAEHEEKDESRGRNAASSETEDDSDEDED